jgi:hypothetical protein
MLYKTGLGLLMLAWHVIASTVAPGAALSTSDKRVLVPCEDIEISVTDHAGMGTSWRGTLWVNVSIGCNNSIDVDCLAHDCDVGTFNCRGGYGLRFNQHEDNPDKALSAWYKISQLGYDSPQLPMFFISY